MVLISSIIAAHHGYLHFWVVVVVAIFGTYGSGVLLYFLGRKRGRDWLDKHPKWNKKAASIDEKIDKYPRLIFFTYRFLFGIRIITPFVIGTSKVRTSTFLIFSGIGTLIWAGIYGYLAYAFGNVIQTELEHIKHIEKYIIAGVALVAIIIVAVKIRNKHHHLIIKPLVSRVRAK